MSSTIRLTMDQRVQGSSPCAPTKNPQENMALRDDVQSPANDPAFVSGLCPVTRVRYRPETGLRGPTDGDASCVLL